MKVTSDRKRHRIWQLLGDLKKIEFQHLPSEKCFHAVRVTLSAFSAAYLEMVDERSVKALALKTFHDLKFLLR